LADEDSQRCRQQRADSDDEHRLPCSAHTASGVRSRHGLDLLGLGLTAVGALRGRNRLAAAKTSKVDREKRPWTSGAARLTSRRSRAVEPPQAAVLEAVRALISSSSSLD